GDGIAAQVSQADTAVHGQGRAVHHRAGADADLVGRALGGQGDGLPVARVVVRRQAPVRAGVAARLGGAVGLHDPASEALLLVVPGGVLGVGRGVHAEGVVDRAAPDRDRADVLGVQLDDAGLAVHRLDRTCAARADLVGRAVRLDDVRLAALRV